MKPIWIVDDDQSIRFVLEKALLREDLPTRSFTNPREVLQALEGGGDEDGPQILVSDIRMPGGSGLDLLSRVKEKHPGLPVIIMTAFDWTARFGFPGRCVRTPKTFDRQGGGRYSPRGGEASRGSGGRASGCGGDAGKASACRTCSAPSAACQRKSRS